MNVHCVRASGAAALLFVLLSSALASAQQANVSVRVAPFGVRAATPLFSVRLDESPWKEGLPLPALTLTNTRSGPQLTNFAFRPPALTVGGAAVASRFGDQYLPAGFLSSPLSGGAVYWPMRGASFGSVGGTPWTLAIGQLDAVAGGGNPEDAAAVAALAVAIAPHARLSAAPRILVPLGSGLGRQASLGTAVRAELMPHLSLVGDLGAAAGERNRWAPLASAGVVAHWQAVELETSVLRGAATAAAFQGSSPVGATDRELVRGKIQALSGVTVAGRLSRSRPAGGHAAGSATTASLAVAYDAPSFGLLTVAQERHAGGGRSDATLHLEWRPPVLTGLMVRYTGAPPGAEHSGSRGVIEIDLPHLLPRRQGRRLRIGATLVGTRRRDAAPVASKIAGSFDVASNVRLGGEAELQLAGGEGHAIVRSMRLTADMGTPGDTVLQVRYGHRAGMALSWRQGGEIRISRSIDLGSW